MAGLPWIQVHTDLPRHPKSVRLGLALGDPRAWTYMVELWAWCAECLPSGAFEGKDSDRVLEHGAGWRGEPGKFVDACVDSGFLEQDGETLRVHDWDVHAGAHMEKRAREVNRLRKYRSRQEKSDRTRTRTLRVRNGDRTRSVPVEREREREIEREKQASKACLQAGSLASAPTVPTAYPLCGELRRRLTEALAFTGALPIALDGEEATRDGSQLEGLIAALGIERATALCESRARAVKAREGRYPAVLRYYLGPLQDAARPRGLERGAASPVSTFADPTYDGPIDFATGLPPRKLVIEEHG